MSRCIGAESTDGTVKLRGIKSLVVRSVARSKGDRTEE